MTEHQVVLVESVERDTVEVRILPQRLRLTIPRERFLYNYEFTPCLAGQAYICTTPGSRHLLTVTYDGGFSSVDVRIDASETGAPPISNIHVLHLLAARYVRFDHAVTVATELGTVPLAVSAEVYERLRRGERMAVSMGSVVPIAAQRALPASATRLIDGPSMGTSAVQYGWAREMPTQPMPALLDRVSRDELYRVPFTEIPLTGFTRLHESIQMDLAAMDRARNFLEVTAEEQAAWEQQIRNGLGIPPDMVQSNLTIDRVHNAVPPNTEEDLPTGDIWAQLLTGD